MSAVRVQIQLALASIVCYHGPQCISVIYWNLLEKWGHVNILLFHHLCHSRKCWENFDFSHTDLKQIMTLQY